MQSTSVKPQNFDFEVLFNSKQTRGGAKERNLVTQKQVNSAVCPIKKQHDAAELGITEFGDVESINAMGIAINGVAFQFGNQMQEDPVWVTTVHHPTEARARVPTQHRRAAAAAAVPPAEQNTRHRIASREGGVAPLPSPRHLHTHLCSHTCTRAHAHGHHATCVSAACALHVSCAPHLGIRSRSRTSSRWTSALATTSATAPVECTTTTT